MKKIAVTGGIATGKTTVGCILKSCGAYFIEIDKTVHKILKEDEECINLIKKTIGIDIFSNGIIDREKLAQKVFADNESLNKLESILHPKLIEEIKQKFLAVENNSKYKAFVVEMPLVQERQFEPFFDIVINVSAARNIALGRYVSDGNSEKSYEARMQYQFSNKKKCLYADFVISNEGSLERLTKQTKELIKEICSR